MTTQQYRRFVAVGIVTFLPLLLYATGASADSLTVKVVKITDGDTLYVLDANYKQHKIRLAGIDAPERKQAYEGEVEAGHDRSPRSCLCRPFLGG